MSSKTDLTSERKHVRTVRRYYRTLESIIGYRLLGGIKHCGYHPNPAHPLSIAAAQQEQNRLVARSLHLERGAKVLECGCGEGSAANQIALENGWLITGIDILPLNIARARRQAKSLGAGSTFLTADYMHMPFENGTFDAVYAMETLVHAPDAHRLFREVNRVLKPGGRLVFCEYSMTPRDKISKGGRETMTIINTSCPMPALEQFTTGAFPSILEKAGFTNVTVTDITANIKPTVVKFYKIARWPMQIVKRLHLERHFVNMYSAYALYHAHVQGDDLMQYNLVTATKAN